VETSEALTRSLANVTSSIVVSVEYRLAPAHPYPAAADDAYEALEWVAENAAALGADPAKRFVGSDSAGGNLAASVALRARDNRRPAVAGQILYYPAIADPSSTILSATGLEPAWPRPSRARSPIRSRSAW
jgi:acetyl esterase